MTKRFTISSESNQNIWDNEEHCYYSSIDAERLYELLNSLNDENEQLKQQITEWQKSTAYWSKQHSELEKSNERLLKMLDNVANYMQKENKYMPIDDFVEWWNGITTKGLDDGDVE